MKTIIKASQQQAQDLLDIYNSANLIFPEEQRADGTIDLFETILREDEVYLLSENEKMTAFLGIHEYESMVELTALYVRLEDQKKGYGTELLRFFELNCNQDKPRIIKVLRNAPWAIQCYQSCGYEELTESRMQELGLKLRLHSWSIVLYKK